MSPGSWGATGCDYDDDWPGWAEEERREDDDPSGGDSGKEKKKNDDGPKTTTPTAAAITSGAVSSGAMKSRISTPPSIGVTIESWQWIEGWTTSSAWSKEITTSFSAT